MAIAHPGHAHVAETAQKLVSWKSIASYFDCDERTAKRWERERGLPVHRAPGGNRSAVFAYSSELDSWLRAGVQTQVSHSPTEAHEPISEDRGPLSVAIESRDVVDTSPGMAALQA